MFRELSRLKPALFFIALAFSASLTTAAAPPPASDEYKQIPYYLRQLEQTEWEDKRVEYNKIVHDLIVTAPLENKKAVKEMEPLIEMVERAMDSGLDRTNVSGRHKWLASAVDYFHREKGRRVVSLPPQHWLPPQTENALGQKLIVTPDRIVLVTPSTNTVIATGAGIHEAILSPTGSLAAYFQRRPGQKAQADIFVVDLKRMRSKKVASLGSCRTILFSLDGKKLYYQQSHTDPAAETDILVMSARGGKARVVGKARMLETLAAGGEHRGALIVYKPVVHHLGGATQECAYAYSKKGDLLGRIQDGPCR